ESPAQQRGHTQIVETVRDESDRVDILRQVVRGQNQRLEVHGQHTLYYRQLPQLPNLGTIRIDPIRRTCFARYRQAHDPVRCGVGIGVDQGGIDHAEHGRSRSNAERKRDDRRQRESWTLDELSEGIADILKPGVHSSPLAVRWMRSIIACVWGFREIVLCSAQIKSSTALR